MMQISCPLLSVLVQVAAIAVATPPVIRSHAHPKGAAMVELSAGGQGVLSSGSSERARHYWDQGSCVCLENPSEFVGDSGMGELRCISPTGSCSTLSSSCAAGGGLECRERLDIPQRCPEKCSAFPTGTHGTADANTHSVCYEAAGKKCHKFDSTTGQCGSGQTWCKQKKIDDCAWTCNDYYPDNTTLINPATETVCQPNLAQADRVMQLHDGDERKTWDSRCFPMPCASGTTGGIMSGLTTPCHQIYDVCTGGCGAGSDAIPAGQLHRTTCSTGTGVCHNPVSDTAAADYGRCPEVNGIRSTRCKEPEPGQVTSGGDTAAPIWRSQQLR